MNKGHYIVSHCIRTEDWYYVTELTKKEKRVVEAKRIEWMRKYHDPITGKRTDNWIAYDEFLKTDLQ